MIINQDEILHQNDQRKNCSVGILTEPTGQPTFLQDFF